ncbi:MAG: excinuclease ABC subunit UvrC [Gammaproteobacteria bacterium]
MTAETADNFDAKAFLATLTHRPGVYRMLDEEGTVIYVGKARDLKKRVSSYFGSKAHHPKTMALMERARRVDVTVTASEREALLLELNLIKRHQPYFNVLLRDSKGYPFIHVSTSDRYPSFSFHRGARKGKGRYLGPFPNSAAVRQTLVHISKLFQVRQCTDTFFANRTRPCLQHQIKRCSAPCVQLISEADYRRDVNNAVLLLEGKDNSVVKDLAARMDKAAARQNYELAAKLRDQIAAIKGLQAKQSITGERQIDTDAIAAFEQRGNWAVAAVMVRGGRVLGSRNFFPRTRAEHTAAEVIAAFISQHYFAGEIPHEILVSEMPDDRAVLEESFADRTGHKVQIRSNVRGTRRGWLEMALANAREALLMKLAGAASVEKQRVALGEQLGMEMPPDRIECFDISHTAGGETVASCVVFGPDGPLKADYRRFNIKDVLPGDDYGAIAQVIRRRYTRVKQNDAPMPDLILVDGGKGQLSVAAKELDEIEFDGPLLVAVAKGPSRKPGREELHIRGRSSGLRLPADSTALHLIQQIRDEAHRFAIAGHRQRRARKRQESPLEGIPGIGPKKRRELLRHFGGIQGVRQASAGDLQKVNGISAALAEIIYDRFHDGSPVG